MVFKLYGILVEDEVYVHGVVSEVWGRRDYPNSVSGALKGGRWLNQSLA